MKDLLGDRIKGYYEGRTRISLPRRTNYIIRIDGKSFHSFAKKCVKPFDSLLMKAMDQTAITLCKEIQGAKMAYVQSDEISILFTDFDSIKTDCWFDGNIQKITSVSASIATKAFIEFMFSLSSEDRSNFNVKGLPVFDSRVFTIPEPMEVSNYFIWRQQDATRNSINMVAQSYFSHKELMGKSTSDVQDMLMLQKEVNWNNFKSGEKRGRAIVKVEYKGENDSIRNKWISLDGVINKETPIFTQERGFILDKLQIKEK